MSANNEELREIAEELLSEHLNSDIEFSVVYESEEAEDLSEEEQRKVLYLMMSADIEFTIPEDEEEAPEQ